MITTRELAKRLAIENKLPRAERYDLYLREYDGNVEVIGWMQDPTADMKNFQGRDRKSTRLNSSHSQQSRMPSSA